MSSVRILIADDEERIREIIREYVEPEGYEIDEASDGEEALSLFRQRSYSLVILDVMMPKRDGWSVCREISRTSQVPVILLTARGEEYDKLFGFELGAEDYVVKPFSPRELLARIKVALCRGERPGDGDREVLAFDGLVIEPDSRSVRVEGETVSLTPKEYELLLFLARNPKRVFSRDQLLSSVWGYDFAGDDRTVDTHVKMLRDSLRDYRRLIVTVWGTGYKFEPEGI